MFLSWPAISNGAKDSETLNLELTAVGAGDGVGKLLASVAIGELDLNGTRITDEQLAALAGFKGTRLGLRATKVTDAGVSAFLDSKPKLARLSLGGTSITDAVVERLESIESLRFLDVSRTKISQRGMSSIRYTLRDCNVLER